MKIKEKTSVQVIIRNYIIALIPLILYGIYKNGIFLYQKDLIEISDIIKLVMFPISGLLIGYVIEFLFNLKTRENIKDSFLPLYGLLVSCVINPNINIFLFLVILFIGLIVVKLISFQKFITINPVSFIKILFLIILIILNKNVYQNLYEISVNQALNPIDILFGRGVGGLFSTNIFFIILAFGFLSFTKLYKKTIPLYMLGTYSLLAIAITLFKNDNSDILLNIFNSTVFFSAVFIAPDLIASVYSKKGKIVYGILLGVLCAVVTNLINNIDGVFIAILVGSIAIKFIDKIFALK